MLWATAKLGSHCPEMLTNMPALLRSSRTLLREMSPQGLSNIAWALATLRFSTKRRDEQQKRTLSRHHGLSYQNLAIVDDDKYSQKPILEIWDNLSKPKDIAKHWAVYVYKVWGSLKAICIVGSNYRFELRAARILSTPALGVLYREYSKFRSGFCTFVAA